MAFPTVVSLTQTNSSTTVTANHSASYPATVDAGDLLLVTAVCFNVASAGNDTTCTASDSGFERPTIFQTTVGAGTTIRLFVFGKIADGTEDGGTFDCSTDVGTRMSFQIFRITGHHDWTGGDINDTITTARSAAEAVNNTSNPPSVTAAWGSDDNLFMYFAIHADDNATVSSYSTNYTNGTHTTPNLGTNQNYGVASARRELAAATDDPGNHTWSETEGHNEITLVIRPTAAAAEATASPSSAVMVFQGAAPALSTLNAPRTSRGPGTGTVLFQGLAPTATTRLEKRLAPSNGTVLFQGLAPATTTENAPRTSRAPTTGTVLFQGLAPTTTTLNAPHTSRAPTTATILFEGQSVSGTYQLLRQTLSPGTATVVFESEAPTANTTAPPRPGTGVIEFYGYAPTTLIKRRFTVSPSPAVVKFVGSAPELSRQLQDWVAVGQDQETWTNLSSTDSTWTDISQDEETWINIAKIWDST